MRTVLALLLLTIPVLAQAPMPLTDWRASLDADLARLSMPREAHQAIFQILQAYEKQAQPKPAPLSPKSLVPPSIPQPKEPEK